MTPRAPLYARLTAAHPLAGLLGCRAARTARVQAARAERLARPAPATPQFTACCDTWPTTGGRCHERTCHIVTEEID